MKIISIFFGAKNNKVQNTFKAIYQLNLAGIKIVYNIVLCLKLIILFGKIHKMDEIFTFLLFLFFFEKYYSKKIKKKKNVIKLDTFTLNGEKMSNFI